MNIDKNELLRQTALFSELGRSDIERLVACARYKSVPAREVLFYQGEEGHQIYAILAGKIQVTTCSELGKEITLSILDAGQILGEISVFSGVPRTATAMTLETTELLVIERCEMIPFLRETPDVAIKMIASLCKRLGVFSANVADIR